MALHSLPIIAGIIGLPAPVALVGTLVFVFFLFWRDIRQRPPVTGALWLPVAWVLLMGSRSLAQWLYVFNFPVGLGSVEEGNPLDAMLYSSLIIAGVYVLSNRGVSLSEVIQDNKWIMVFLFYCFIAIVWSDYPFVSFKRFIKILGHPVMALVIFTEPDFDEALATVMKRSAYVLVTFSVMAIKWFPNIGRRFDQWTGEDMNVGITQSKNLLGCACLIFGLFFFLRFLR